MVSSQLELFEPRSDVDRSPIRVPAIGGLRYVEDFLSAREQERVIQAIDASSWRNDLQRRVQHYGWRYDYKARVVTRNMRIGPFPPWLQALGLRLREVGLFGRVPDQAIVNEYQPGQGIAMHVDRQCFGPVVATVSLGDAWQMDLRPTRPTNAHAEHVLLGTGSVLVLTGDARYRWLHGIAPRRRERDGDHWRPRERRLSVTFRTVLLDEA